MTETKFALQRIVAREAAKLAGNVIRGSIGSVDVSTKSGDVDLVTQVDRDAEQIIIDHIRKTFPNDVVIGEESSSSSSSSFKNKESCKDGDPIPLVGVWCIDPLDGTTNFVHGYPFVAVSIGYCLDGTPRVGVIYHPFAEELYEAEEHQGAFCNGTRIQVDSSSTTLSNALLVNNIGHTRRRDFIDESTERIGRWLHGGLRGYRSSGSAALNMAHVSSGKVSCFYEHGYGGPWDVCAGMVVVQEAGGIVLDARRGGSEFRLCYGKGSICCGNKSIVMDVIRVAQEPKAKLGI